MTQVIATFAKDADEKLDYSVDWSDWMATGDAISTSTWSMETFTGDAAPLAVSGSPAPSVNTELHKTTVWVEAGSPGLTYLLTNTVVTTAGRTGERAIAFDVSDQPRSLLVVETGAALTNSNSYATVAQADAYYSRHLYGSVWTAADTDRKERALMTATRLIDDNFDFAGNQANIYQALSWPRFNVYHRDGFAVRGDTLPTALTNATSELARWLLADDRTAEAETLGFTSMTVGSLALTVDRDDRRRVIPSVVRAMLAPFVSSKPGQMRLTR